jgi:signal peptidase II
MNVSKKQFWGKFFLVFIPTILFALDRLTKWFALHFLQGKEVAVFPGLTFDFSWNRGISWGMLSKTTDVGFYVLTSIIAVVIFLFVLYIFSEFRKGTNVLFELIVFVGALSNIIDRILYKGVIDFIDCYVGAWHWPTYNLADAFIIIGVLGILGRSIYYAHLGKNKDC